MLCVWATKEFPFSFVYFLHVFVDISRSNLKFHFGVHIHSSYCLKSLNILPFSTHNTNSMHSMSTFLSRALAKSYRWLIFNGQSECATDSFIWQQIYQSIEEQSRASQQAKSNQGKHTKNITLEISQTTELQHVCWISPPLSSYKNNTRPCTQWPGEWSVRIRRHLYRRRRLEDQCTLCGGAGYAAVERYVLWVLWKEAAKCGCGSGFEGVYWVSGGKVLW